MIDHSLAQFAGSTCIYFFWNSRVSPITIEGLLTRNAELLLFMLVSYSFMLRLVAEKMYKAIEGKKEEEET